MAKKTQPSTAASPQTKRAALPVHHSLPNILPIHARLSAGAGRLVLPAKDYVRIAVLGDPHFNHSTPESRMDDYAETCLRKFRNVVNKSLEVGCSVLILLGDLWNKPSQPMSYYNRVQREFVKAWLNGLAVMTIPGNHDLPFHKMSKLGDTSLGALVGSGWCPILDRIRFEVKVNEGVRVVDLVGAGIDIEPKPRDSGAWRSIYFDHKFWRKGPDEYVLTDEDAVVLGHDVYCLGHDHIAYEDLFVEGEGREFLVVRPGSMTRATSHFHQVLRDVRFSVLQYGEENALWHEPIDCLPPDQVYRFESLEKRKPIKKIEVERFVDEIERHVIDGRSAYTFLDRIKAEPEVKQYVWELMAQHGVGA